MTQRMTVTTKQSDNMEMWHNSSPIPHTTLTCPPILHPIAHPVVHPIAHPYSTQIPTRTPPNCPPVLHPHAYSTHLLTPYSTPQLTCWTPPTGLRGIHRSPVDNTAQVPASPPPPEGSRSPHLTSAWWKKLLRREWGEEGGGEGGREGGRRGGRERMKWWGCSVTIKVRFQTAVFHNPVVEFQMHRQLPLRIQTEFNTIEVH